MIESFSGEFRFLSNFFPCKIEFEGINFNSTENAYQAAKTLDLNKRIIISGLTPGQAKRAGKALVLREDWEQVKLGIMESLLIKKFSIPELGQMLKNTGSQELIEGNTWGDTFWGVCDNMGDNHLGKLLMKVRSSLT